MERTTFISKFLTVYIAQIIVLMLMSICMAINSNYTIDFAIITSSLFTISVQSLFNASLITVIWLILDFYKNNFNNKFVNVSIACFFYSIANNYQEFCSNLNLLDFVQLLLNIVAILLMEKIFLYLNKKRCWIQFLSKFCSILTIICVYLVLIFELLLVCTKFTKIQLYNFPCNIIRDLIGFIDIRLWSVLPQHFGRYIAPFLLIGIIVLIRLLLLLYFNDLLKNTEDTSNEKE